MRYAQQWQQQPVQVGITWGSVTLGVLGCIAGLLRGLTVYAPTAWAATFEVGLPSAVLGAVLGAAAGLAALASRRVRH